MLNIFCLHSANNYSVVLVNSMAVLGVAEHCANKYLVLFCAVTEADAVNRAKNDQILQLKLLFICLFPKEQGHLDLSCKFCSISGINASILEVSESKKKPVQLGRKAHAVCSWKGERTQGSARRLLRVLLLQQFV